MTDHDTDPAGASGPVGRARSQRAASSTPPGGASPPNEVTATIAPRREAAAERPDVRSGEPSRGTTVGTAAGTTVGTAAGTVSDAAVRPNVARPSPSVAAAPATATTAATGTATAAIPASPARPTDDPAAHPGGRRPALHPGQLVCWQLAAALIATSVGRALWIVTAAVLVGFALVALTATWHRDLWTYQRAVLGLRQLARDPRFVPVEAILRTIEIGETNAAALVRPSGITAVLEVAVPSESPDPAALLERHTDLESKLLVQRDRAWLALTAARTVDRHTDTELELLLVNAIRRLIGRSGHASATHRTLGPDELAEVVARLAPGRAREEWNGLRLWTGRYRMYAAPPDLVHPPPGAVTVTLADGLDHALVLAPAGTPPGAGSVPLTGRQRSALTAALP